MTTPNSQDLDPAIASWHTLLASQASPDDGGAEAQQAAPKIETSTQWHAWIAEWMGNHDVVLKNEAYKALKCAFRTLPTSPEQAAPQAGAPTNPMDWPLPCDVTVGHGTMRKGVKLGTLVARMKVLYRMATGTAADEVANRTPEERQALFDASPLGQLAKAASAPCGLCAGKGFYGTPGAQCDWCKGSGTSLATPLPAPQPVSADQCERVIKAVQSVFGGQTGNSNLVEWAQQKQRAHAAIRAALSPTQAEPGKGADHA